MPHQRGSCLILVANQATNYRGFSWVMTVNLLRNCLHANHVKSLIVDQIETDQVQIQKGRRGRAFVCDLLKLYAANPLKSKDVTVHRVEKFSLQDQSLSIWSQNRRKIRFVFQLRTLEVEIREF